MIKFIIISFFLLGVIACSENNPSKPSEDHIEVAGLSFYENGVNTLKIFEGDVISPQSEFEVDSGAESSVINVRLINEDGVEQDPDTEDDEYTFAFEIENNQVLSIKNEESNQWHFKLIGLNKGSTYIEFQILHNGHIDFRTPKVKVNVK